ncbi:DUF1285 domain-containing protein [Cobetia sp. L2A1]|uniref:DUF1285 domain-containing protein n=1 Tax=Cobetia sp. L2A1 TaxID=2686360 RepID=UPI00131DAF41|nr:DUF1285 domain-containing protein [Cobetia sp. L2A1]
MNPAAILTQLGKQAEVRKSLPPVDQWHPEHCGEMDLVICRDGRWMHEGTPIGRARLVHMLSRVLRREPDGSYCLVTPVEKVTIQVEDRPFLAVDCTLAEDDMQAESDTRDDDAPTQAVWQLVTDQGDVVRLEGETCLVLSEALNDEWLPEVPVRFGLAARLHRNLYYRLLETAETRELDDGGHSMGFMSGGSWQCLGRLSADEIDA